MEAAGRAETPRERSQEHNNSTSQRFDSLSQRAFLGVLTDDAWSDLLSQLPEAVPSKAEPIEKGVNVVTGGNLQNPLGKLA